MFVHRLIVHSMERCIFIHFIRFAHTECEREMVIWSQPTGRLDFIKPLRSFTNESRTEQINWAISWRCYTFNGPTAYTTSVLNERIPCERSAQIFSTADSRWHLGSSAIVYFIFSLEHGLYLCWHSSLLLFAYCVLRLDFGVAHFETIIWSFAPSAKIQHFFSVAQMNGNENRKSSAENEEGKMNRRIIWSTEVYWAKTCTSRPHALFLIDKPNGVARLCLYLSSFTFPFTASTCVYSRHSMIRA